jgi:hypothetical protein
MIAVDGRFAYGYLRRPEVGSFWWELGFATMLPPHFSYLYERDVGLFVLEPVERFMGIHVAIPPAGRGSKAVAAGKEAFRIVLERCEKVLARVRIEDRQARHFAVQCGMRRYSLSRTHTFYEVTKCR